jgi:hypothetical protein
MIAYSVSALFPLIRILDLGGFIAICTMADWKCKRKDFSWCNYSGDGLSNSALPLTRWPLLINNKRAMASTSIVFSSVRYADLV